MDIANFTQITERIPQEQRDALLRIIEIKMNDDMKDLIFAIEKSTEANKMMTQQSTEAYKMMTQQLKEAYELQFQTLRTEIKTIYWVLGIVGSVLAIAITIALAVFAK